uniref:Immunoglobulin V-set domain-containing protein n=1 Tax=Callorhinchus milii TaxID=7868 RepID=A0A4W3JWJ9_CALMI
EKPIAFPSWETTRGNCPIPAMFTLLLVTVVGSLVLANEDKHVSGEKGSTISFDCNPWPYKDSVANTRRGHSTGSRFSISKIQNSDGARVQITQLSDSDAGTWWCGTERPYGDLYQKIVINVLKSQQSKITEGPAIPHWETLVGGNGLGLRTDCLSPAPQPVDWMLLPGHCDNWYCGVSPGS